MTYNQDILDRIKRVENLIIIDLVMTAAIIGEKVIEIIPSLLS